MSDRLMMGVCAMGLLLAAALPIAAQAQDKVREPGNIGLGLGGNIFGAGVSGKYFIDESNAVQGLVGLGYSSTSLTVSADYLYNFPPFVQEEDLSIGWYAGFGGALVLGASVLGVTGIVGVDVDVDEVPLDLFVEYRPSLYFMTIGSGFRGDSFGAGVRYYF
jgi:hypothetical protein